MLAVNTPYRNDNDTNSHPQVSNVLSSSVLNPRTRTSTPIFVPWTDSLVVLKPSAPLLSRNQHSRTKTRPDVKEKGRDDSGARGDVLQLPTGNFPWMLKANTNPSKYNEETAIEVLRSSNDSLKRPRTELSRLQSPPATEEDGDPE